jgi:hypothetical protein
MARSSSRVLTDHNEIQQWVEERNAKPACVSRTGRGDIGMIRLEFPDAPNANDSNLEEISWDDFFNKFDESNLGLLVQDELAEGGRSNFNKLVSRENAGDKSRRGTASRRASRGRTSTKASKSASTSARKVATKSAGRVSGRSRTKKATKKSASKQAAKKTASKGASAKKSAAKKTASRRGRSASSVKRGSKTASRRVSSAKRSMTTTGRTASTTSNREGGKRASSRGTR